MGQNICLVETHVVKIIDNKVLFLVLKRSDDEKYPGVWQPVTGHVKKNEKAFATAFREVYEETGLNAEKIFVVPHINRYYNPETDKICDIPVFLAISDKNFEPVLSSEHSEYFWGELNQVEEFFMWPGQKYSARIIQDFLTKKQNKLYFAEIKK